MSSHPLAGELVGMLAHDLRTPLSSIILHLELLEGAEGLSPDEREDAAFALASARALSELLSVAVGATRGVEPTLGDHDLAALVRQALERGPEEGAPRPIELSSPDTLVARCDAALALRMVRQMLRAAEAATPPGRPVRIRLRSDGAGARLEVEDEGATVPEHLREELFDAGGAVDIRADHRALSRGLGPVFCREVALAHGGAAGLDPAAGLEGRGNVFWIELPLGSTAGPT